MSRLEGVEVPQRKLKGLWPHIVCCSRCRLWELDLERSHAFLRISILERLILHACSMSKFAGARTAAKGMRDASDAQKSNTSKAGGKDSVDLRQKRHKKKYAEKSDRSGATRFGSWPARIGFRPPLGPKLCTPCYRRHVGNL